MDYREVISKVKKSIAYVRIGDAKTKQELSHGSGFVFQKEGILVTCEHVVRTKNEEILIRFSDADSFIPAEVVLRDEEHDIALLKFDERSRPPVLISDLTKVSPGMEVFFSGFPLDINSLVSNQGIISAVADDATGITTYIIDGTVSPGNSGGPLMDNKGNVVGVVNAMRREGKHVLDRVQNMPPGVISLFNTDMIEIYSAIIRNLQLGIGYAVPASYIPEHKAVSSIKNGKKE